MGHLALESYHLAYALAMQGSTEARNMPSPLAAQLRFDCLVRFGSKMLRHMGDYLWHIIMSRPDMSTLPVHFSPPIYLGLATIQGWNLASVLHHPQRPAVPLDVQSIYQIMLEDQASSPSVVARIKLIPRYRLDTRPVQRPENMPLPEGGGEKRSDGGSQWVNAMADGIAPQYMHASDPYASDMSWLLDFETDWMALVNGRVDGM